MNTRKSLSARSWPLVEEEYLNREPFGYVVLDDFLAQGVCSTLHKKMLSHWGWRYKNWISDHLHTRWPDIPEILEIASELSEACPNILKGLTLVDFWGLMYRENKPGKMHSDNTAVTLTLWLTPSKYNTNFKASGLLLSDVLRDPTMLPHEHLVYPWANDYFCRTTKGGATRIPYQQNRAVLFNARIFHRTDDLFFSFSKFESFRVNLSLAFDDPREHERRVSLMRSAPIYPTSSQSGDDI